MLFKKYDLLDCTIFLFSLFVFLTVIVAIYAILVSAVVPTGSTMIRIVTHLVFDAVACVVTGGIQARVAYVIDNILGRRASYQEHQQYWLESKATAPTRHDWEVHAPSRSPFDIADVADICRRYVFGSILLFYCIPCFRFPVWVSYSGHSFQFGCRRSRITQKNWTLMHD